VLDGILDNETELPIAEHTSDTAGYTDLVFSLFDLLGLQFSPRLRDLGEGASLPEIGDLLRHRRPDTTAIYAKVDLVSLRSIALPWPGGGR
jgi:hypothetical protein